MKGLKQWLLALMAVFMVAGIATGCSNNDKKTDGTNTQQNQDADNTKTEESGQ
ncbi:hypothetical protein [Bacillus methanolicus]|uniref:Secreted protein n=1 Tax=Bacillus methanolicus (strain MGA3 / ATCC 53907) TaxID=796606 RepID=I3E7Y0_BACMM|nr:hypothetical protein [Bacillus methanolicus]AIE59416.1 hypothetical protein BMMGA3_04920 [Bacillus methanolicus MGA3]EIJ82601.1 hypothetical protein MGA3_05170 [Bacillus methanolicus MGA3]